ncbi:SLBB domain-containing protein [Roseateles sp. DB2]|uniref:polysaccharide biosynthesis/export family protein n=1 Tax=Roseateles sp. DB2 TaxID=3453717 RepID=UPI003EEE2107
MALSITLAFGTTAFAQQAPTPAPVVPGATSAGLDRSGNTLLQLKEAPDAELNAVKRRPPTETSSQELAFQDFVYRNYGRWLPVYGLDSFSFEDQGFDSPVSTMPTELYELGPGDEVRVKLTGPVELDATLVVDNTGFISLPKVGSVAVAGVRRNDLQAAIHKAVARYYTGFNLHVATGKLRNISVLVVGQAMRPGAYRMPATSSLLNGVYAAAGAAPTGSLRAIRLMRQGKLVAQLDFYELIGKGSSEGDVQLRNGDVIHIPPAGGRVALLGSTNVQGIFELSPSGTTLSGLLQLAGGASASSRIERVTVDRIDRQRPEAPRQVLIVDLSKAGADFKLEDGDVVSLQEMGQRFANMVVVRGSVYQPLRRPWTPGMRVTTIVPNRSALYSPTVARARNELAMGETGGSRKRIGQLTQQALGTSGTGGANAAQRHFGVQDDSQELSGEKLESHVSAESINWTLASVERLNAVTGQVELINFNLGRALANPLGADDPELQPGDHVVIYSDRSLALPEELRTRYVKIEGEVGQAGVYQLAARETLKDVLQRAGGLTTRAYLYGLKLTRSSQVTVQKQQLRKAAQLLEDMVSQQSAALLSSSGGAEQRALNESLAQEIRRRADQLRRQVPDGRVALEIPVDAKLAQLPDLPLEDGDTVHVPAMPSEVSVYGAVSNPLTAVYDSRRDLHSYVRAAQPKRTADLGELFVIRANGMAEHVSSGMFSSGTAKAYPGDTVFVPEEPVRLSLTSAWMTGLKDWSQVLVQMLIGAKVAKDL